MLGCHFPSIAMPLTVVLQRIVRRVRDTNGTSLQIPTGRSQEQQRDESSVADFVRILQEHDNRSR
jgi:hypothetical protein